MAQFPLALAIEPRLLPLAVSNGFSMDSKVRGNLFCSKLRLIFGFPVPRLYIQKNVREAYINE
jgi:hypothetical protein